MLFASQTQQRMFSKEGRPPPPRGDDKYVSEDERDEFESDRRFSNFVLFSGTLALGVLFMMSSVMANKRKKSVQERDQL